MLQNDNRVAFNIKYYPIFKNIRNISEELHISLAPDGKHKNVFAGIPRICFKNGKSLKDHFIRSVLPKVEVADNSGQSDGKWPPGKLCRLIKETSTFI